MIGVAPLRQQTGDVPNAPITVLLVDDQPAVRYGLRLRFGLESDLRVVGEATDGLMGLKLAEALAPDVVVMDVAMPVMDGLAATAAMRSPESCAGVVVLTLHDDRQTLARAAASGAVAIVSKHEPSQALIDAIRRAAQRRNLGEYCRLDSDEISPGQPSVRREV